MSCFIQVYGRVRPSARGETNTALQITDKGSVTCNLPTGEKKSYELHRVFPATSTQEEVFHVVAKNIIEDCLQGINGTIFAYGQTGSGKTHTMLGPTDSWSDSKLKGLIPRAIDHMFNLLDENAQMCQEFKYFVSVNFIELYNEVLYDLLNDSVEVTIRDTGNEISLNGAQELKVENKLDLMRLLQRGWEARRTGETAMNKDSSRSHALILLKIKTEEMNGGMSAVRESTLNLVDLAGSERQKHTLAVGKRFKEANSINASLSVLGRAIRELAARKTMNDAKFFPYRESSLTHLLKNSLGGNSKTAVVVNVHPDSTFINETTSTLIFATQCSMIQNQVSKNEKFAGFSEDAYKTAILNLRKQIDELKEKTQKDYADRISNLEESEKKWRDIANEQEKKNNGLRVKYDMLLKKKGQSDEELPEEVIAKVMQCYQSSGNKDVDQLHLELQTMKLELDSKSDTIEELKNELAISREKLSDQMNETFARMKTPNPSRKSSRNPRRETLYAPSPARIQMQSISDDEDKENIISEWECKYQQSQIDLENYKAKCTETEKNSDNLSNQVVRLQNELTELKSDSQKVIYELESEIKRLQLESSENADKVLKGRAEMDMLLVTLKGKDDELKKMYANETNLRKDSEEQLQATTKYFTERLAKKEVEHKADLSVLSQQHEEQQSLSASQVQQMKSDIAKAEKLSIEKDEEFKRLTDELKKAEEDSMNLKMYKLRYEEEAERIAQLQRQISDLKQNQQSRFLDYQEGMKLSKAKWEEEITDVKKSLENERQAHEETRQNESKRSSKMIEKFEEEMAQLRKDYERQRLIDRKEVEEGMTEQWTALSKKKDRTVEEKMFALEARLKTYEERKEEDDRNMKENFGHNNKKQKLSYIENLRQKSMEMEFEIKMLKGQVELCRKNHS